MGLDITFEKRSKHDANAQKRKELNEEYNKLEEELNSRGTDYYDVLNLQHSIDCEKNWRSTYVNSMNDANEPIDDERVKRFDEQIEHYQELLDKIENKDELIKKHEEDKPLWDKFGEVSDELDKINLYTEVCYFRKVNFLVAFFNYEENCSHMEIGRDDVQELYDRCLKVLDNHDLASELLPVEKGFFFGSYDYDDWYFKQVEIVRDEMKSILDTFDWENNILAFHCWW